MTSSTLDTYYLSPESKEMKWLMFDCKITILKKTLTAMVWLDHIVLVSLCFYG